MAEMLISRELFTTRVNSTMMSMNERFTYLQKKARPAQTSVLTIRAKNSAQQQASAKNRRLAMQMEKRLSAMAALRIKKKSIRQRLGIPKNTVAANVRDRLSLPQRKKAIRAKIRRNRGKSLQRSQSMQSLQGNNLQRTSSIQSLNKGMARRGRSRSRSRARAQTPNRNARANSINRQPQQRSSSVGRQLRKAQFGNRQQRFNMRPGGQQAIKRGKLNFMVVRNQRLGNRGIKFNRNQRGLGAGQRNRGNFPKSNFQFGRNQQIAGKRGQNRNKLGPRSQLGRGRTKVITPTKEELDKQLDQYMANTQKSHLDTEIDTYMKESGVNDF